IMERQTGHSIGRTEWDKNLTRSAAITGAIGGALGPIMQGLGHYPTKALGHALGGILGKNAGHEAGHWLGETIKGAAHEWVTDGTSGVAQHQGWKPDTFSTTAGAIDEGVSGLAGLGGRKGGHRYYRGMLRGGAGVPDTHITIPDKISIDPPTPGTDPTSTTGNGATPGTGSGTMPGTGTTPTRNSTGAHANGANVNGANGNGARPPAADQSPAVDGTVVASTVEIRRARSPQTPDLTYLWAPAPPHRVTVVGDGTGRATAPPTGWEALDPGGLRAPGTQLPATQLPATQSAATQFPVSPDSGHLLALWDSTPTSSPLPWTGTTGTDDIGYDGGWPQSPLAQAQPSVAPAPPPPSPAPAAGAVSANDPGVTQAEVNWLLSLVEGPQQGQEAPSDAGIPPSAAAPPWAGTSTWADPGAWSDAADAAFIDPNDPWAEITRADLTAPTDTAWVDPFGPGTTPTHLPPLDSPSTLPMLPAEPVVAQGIPSLPPMPAPVPPGLPGRDVRTGPEAHLVGPDQVQPGVTVDAVTRPYLHSAWLTPQATAAGAPELVAGIGRTHPAAAIPPTAPSNLPISPGTSRPPGNAPLNTGAAAVDLGAERRAWSAVRNWPQGATDATPPPERVRPPAAAGDATARQQGVTPVADMVVARAIGTGTTADTGSVSTTAGRPVETPVGRPVEPAGNPGISAATDSLALPSGDRPAVPSVFSHPASISKDTRAAARRLFQEAGIDVRDSAYSRFLVYWPVNATHLDETSSAEPVDWAQQWRDSPELAAVLAELLVLSVLQPRSYSTTPRRPPKTARPAESDPNPYPAFRAAWGRAVMGAVWHRTERADPARPADDGAYPAPARTAEHIADVVASRNAPGGETHNTQGVAVTHALAQAFLDQTLQAVQAVEASAPELATQVRKAHATASSNLARLSVPANKLRSFPQAWANLVTEFVADVNAGAGSQVWAHLRDHLPEPAVPRLPAAPSLPPASGRATNRTLDTMNRTLNATKRPWNGAGLTPDRSAATTGWEERDRAREIIYDPGLDAGTQSSARQKLSYWSGKTGRPEDARWAPWRANWAAEGTFASVLALALLPWPEPGKPDYQRLREIRGEHEQIALATLWRQVEATAQARGDGTGPADPTAHARRVAAEITEVAATTGNTGLYDLVGRLPAAGLARAFVEQTLEAVKAATPGPTTARLVDRVRRAHGVALSRMTTFLGSRAADGTAKAQWADLLTTFVSDLEAAHGQVVWTTLRDWLQGPPRPQGTAPAAFVGHQLPREVALHDQLRVGPQITADEHRETLEILGPRLEGPARQQAEDRLARFWKVQPAPVARAAGPGQATAPRSRRQAPRTGVGLPSLVALSILPWPSADLSDGPGLAGVRDELQRALLGALWQVAETTAPAAPSSGAALSPEGTAARVAAMVTAQGSPDGTRYDEAAVLATAALTRALLDQTLRAAEAAEPGLAEPVRQAHREALTAVSDLLDPTHVNHTWPAAWASVPAYFFAALANRPGTLVWAHLADRLHGRPPRPGDTGLPAGPSLATGAGRPSDPMEQAPWFRGLLPDQGPAQAPLPSPVPAPASTPAPSRAPSRRPAPVQDPPPAKRRRTSGRR
ncbi:MAG TPA: hypothetical protein VFP72_03885, partial [Kineosporiaceae bacterium]|nr:hypothetical protein [Kineosporiaceae bacterium]